MPHAASISVYVGQRGPFSCQSRGRPIGPKLRPCHRVRHSGVHRPVGPELVLRGCPSVASGHRDSGPELRRGTLCDRGVDWLRTRAERGPLGHRRSSASPDRAAPPSLGRLGSSEEPRSLRLPRREPLPLLPVLRGVARRVRCRVCGVASGRRSGHHWWSRVWRVPSGRGVPGQLSGCASEVLQRHVAAVGHTARGARS